MWQLMESKIIYMLPWMYEDKMWMHVYMYKCLITQYVTDNTKTSCMLVPKRYLFVICAFKCDTLISIYKQVMRGRLLLCLK